MADVKTKTVLTVLTVVAVIGGAYWLINRKNTLSFTGAGGKAPAPSQPVGGVGGSGSGNQVYSTQANVILRSSARTNDPFLIFGGNVNLTIENSGTWLGTLVSVVPDQDSAINPATGSVYNWYQISLGQTLAQGFSLPAGSVEFVREDFVTVR